MINRFGRVETFEKKDMIDEMRAFFASGTNLQELYIHKDFMTSETWMCWPKRRVGKEPPGHHGRHPLGRRRPGKFEIYGRASWSKEKAVLALRNPDDQARTIRLDIAHAFELPEGAPRHYSLKSPWKEDQGKAAISVSAGEPYEFRLEPFEVLVLDARPVAGR